MKETQAAGFERVIREKTLDDAIDEDQWMAKEKLRAQWPGASAPHFISAQRTHRLMSVPWMAGPSCRMGLAASDFRAV